MTRAEQGAQALMPTPSLGCAMTHSMVTMVSDVLVTPQKVLDITRVDHLKKGCLFSPIPVRARPMLDRTDSNNRRMTFGRCLRLS
ncbi:MAG: hypothetical protein ACJAZO_004852 [Myxococcota bacterium]|jgi:hypothetical protein